MDYTVYDTYSGENVSTSKAIGASLPPDAGDDQGDVDLPTNWDSGGTSGTPISSTEGELVLVNAIEMGEWTYTQGCAQCGAQPWVYTEPVVNPATHYGDCTDFVQAAIKNVLGSAWPHSKISTKMFNTLTSTQLASHGYEEVDSADVRAGDVVVRAKTTGCQCGHAGIFDGWAQGGNPIGWANNGAPATHTSPNADGSTKAVTFKAKAGEITKFFRPEKN